MDMPAPVDKPPSSCGGVREILNRIGDKWTVQVVVSLYQHHRRFNDIKRHVGGISQQMLTRTLRTLERDGFVSRVVFPTTPPQVEYALTDLGRSLSVPLRQLAEWARGKLDAIYDRRAVYDAAG